MQVSSKYPILILCPTPPTFWTGQSTNNTIIISKATLCYVREKIIIASLVVYTSVWIPSRKKIRKNKLATQS